jgi:hypothetical protein
MSFAPGQLVQAKHSALLCVTTGVTKPVYECITANGNVMWLRAEDIEDGLYRIDDFRAAVEENVKKHAEKETHICRLTDFLARQ